MDGTRQRIVEATVELHGSVGPAVVTAARVARLQEMRSVLTAGWKVKGRRRLRLGAAIAHALNFRTCESLLEAGLSSREAAELMAELVGVAGR